MLRVFFLLTFSVTKPSESVLQVSASYMPNSVVLMQQVSLWLRNNCALLVSCNLCTNASMPGKKTSGKYILKLFKCFIIYVHPVFGAQRKIMETESFILKKINLIHNPYLFLNSSDNSKKIFWVLQLKILFLNVTNKSGVFL